MGRRGRHGQPTSARQRGEIRGVVLDPWGVPRSFQGFRRGVVPHWCAGIQVVEVCCGRVRGGPQERVAH
eukprot:7820086-Pyramimonas_sp.AAC.1